MLYGGKSGEHEVSLRSAATVARFIDESRFDILFIGISKEGVWYLQESPPISGSEKETDRLAVKIDENRVVTVVPGRGLYTKGKKLKI